MYPTPFTVEHSTAVVVGENALGQSVTERQTRTRPVYGWRMVRMNPQGGTDMSERVLTGCYLLTPEPDWSHGDIVTIPGKGDFQVHGDVEDNNTGPFGFQPGYRVHMKQVHHEPS